MRTGYKPTSHKLPQYARSFLNDRGEGIAVRSIAYDGTVTFVHSWATGFQELTMSKNSFLELAKRCTQQTQP